MKTISLLAFAVSSLLAVAAARAQDTSGFFVNGAVGNGSVDGDVFDDDTTTLQINGGYRWGVVGVEGGYVNFNDFDDSFGVLSLDGSLDGWTLGVNARGNFADNWYVSGRAGAFFWDADGGGFTITPGGTPVAARFSDDGTDFYAGVGVGYDFNERWSLGLAYDYFGADGDFDEYDADVFSLTGEVRF
jgi:OOP family OmpA-OmpF porin/outer membrane immunogenic protein